MTKQEELATLRRKLAAREGFHGLEANVRALKARIAELESE
jgi:hypothetical protein